mgnify:CR=1 FL=1
MKVKIGKYTNWFGPHQLADMLRYVGVPEKYRDRLANRMSEKPFEWFDKTFKKRKIKIQIDPWDTWGADHTLALIIVPMLKQLKATKYGAPNVDDEDVPENLRSTNATPKEKDYDVDEFHFARWDFALDEMIFAFESVADDSWEDQFYSGETDLQWKTVEPLSDDPKKQLYEAKEGPNHTFKIDKEGLDAYNKRIDNGLRLFSKYYRNLWT